MKNPPDKLVKSAPEGTVWFGGPFDRSKASLRIFGDELNPDEISSLLGVPSTCGEKKGNVIVGKVTKHQRIAKIGRWSLDSNLPDEVDVDEKLNDLLDQASSDESVWASINEEYRVDIFCGMFMEAENRGFSLSVNTLQRLASLGIEVGFDVYAPDRE